MGLRSWAVGRAVRATRVLVVEAPGAWPTRVAAERALDARGWRSAGSPATADVLLVVGAPGDDLAGAVELLWDAMPGPRVRADLPVDGDPDTVLDAAASSLADGAGQRRDAERRDVVAAPGERGSDHGDMDHEDCDDEGMDHESGDHEGTDHEDGDDEGMDHEGMDHGDMEMEPDGIPLADSTPEDRDGLEMDVLPLRLGPVLPSWPAGLALDVTLHGDLVTEAVAHRVGGPEGGAPAEDTATRAARRCDDVAAVLALAGWEHGARTARAARDVLLDRRGDDARATLADLRYQVEHSRTLRWSLGGAGVLTPERVRELGLPEAVAGDCRDRLLVLLDRAEAAARAYGASHGPLPDDLDPLPLDALGPLLEGLDLGVARLVVASLGSDLLRAGVAAGV